MAEDNSSQMHDNNDNSVEERQDRGVFWDSKPWQAFKTVAILFSFAINIVVLILLLAILPLVLPLVDAVVKPLVGGLNNSFVDMSEATISRTIEVNDNIDIAFTLPLDTETVVRVTEPVPLRNIPASFVLPDGGGYINGSVSLDLPQDLALPVALNLEVPVEQTIPVNLAVGVDIPLSETELGKPFSTLVGLFSPLNRAIENLPDSNEELIDRVLTPAATATPPAGYPGQ
ncbi:MAG: hypothetical protein KC441_02685 [Anaerolineales bacterium]|nr:hypothetical protein [Anaerolineales bacterium]